MRGEVDVGASRDVRIRLQRLLDGRLEVAQAPIVAGVQAAGTEVDTSVEDICGRTNGLRQRKDLLSLLERRVLVRQQQDAPAAPADRNSRACGSEAVNELDGAVVVSAGLRLPARHPTH